LSFLSPILSGKGLPRVTEILRKHYESLGGPFSEKAGRCLLPCSPRRAGCLARKEEKNPETSRWAQI